MIAVVGGDNTLDPVVVVDHEITHIILSNRSSLGTLRHVRFDAVAGPRGPHGFDLTSSPPR